MLWLKAFHVVFVVTWFAGLFYLPRLFVYHVAAEEASAAERFQVMERRLFVMMTIGATLAAAFGLSMLVAAPGLLTLGWQFDGIVMDATEQELADACALGDRTGMFNCPHTGVALAALDQTDQADKIDKSDHVVVISTAHGLKFTDFKVDYHKEKLGFPSTYANRPIELPPTVSAVKKALEQELKKRREQHG